MRSRAPTPRYRRRTLLARAATVAGAALAVACAGPAATRRAVPLVERTATPAPTPPPTRATAATPPPLPTATAAPRPATPTPRPAGVMTIAPPAAPPGTPFAVEVAGLAPATGYVVQALDATGRRYRDDHPVTSDAGGRWVGFFHSAPGDPPGVYTVRVVARQGGAIAAAGAFTITPGASSAPHSPQP